MSEEKQLSPVFKPTKSVSFKDGENTIEFVIQKSKYVANGVSKMFDRQWFLWPIKVKGAKVFGKEDGKEIEIQDYTGEAIIFASEKMNEELLNVTNGMNNVKVLMKREIEEGQKGPYNKKSFEKIGEGTVPEPSIGDLTISEKKLVTDVKQMIANQDIPELSIDDFVMTAKEKPYNISELRARILYKYIKGEENDSEK